MPPPAVPPPAPPPSRARRLGPWLVLLGGAAAWALWPGRAPRDPAAERAYLDRYIAERIAQYRALKQRPDTPPAEVCDAARQVVAFYRGQHDDARHRAWARAAHADCAGAA